MRRTPSHHELVAFRMFATLIVFLGSIASAGLVWDTADMLQGLIVLVNIPAILLLGNTAVRCLKDYTDQRAQGKEPRFLAKSIGLKDHTDFWN